MTPPRIFDVRVFETRDGLWRARVSWRDEDGEHEWEALQRLWSPAAALAAAWARIDDCRHGGTEAVSAVFRLLDWIGGAEK